MTLLQAIFLGIVQGLTEFLPISSSGHLILAEQLLNLQLPQPLFFVVLLHLATLLAVLIYFKKTIWQLCQGAINRNPDSLKMIFALILATLPLVAGALLFNDFIETTFTSTGFIFLAMFCTGIFFILAEKINQIKATTQTFFTQNFYLLAFVIGVFQALAMLPGVSRSGITLGAGLLLGLTRVKSAEFSFLLAIPAIAGAGIFALKDSDFVLTQADILPYTAGFIVSAIIAYFCIWGLLKLYKTHSLIPFAIYLLIVGAMGLL